MELESLIKGQRVEFTGDKIQFKMRIFIMIRAVTKPG